MAIREDFPMVGNWGARLAPQLDPGLRQQLTPRPKPAGDRLPVEVVARSTRAARAAKRPGFGK